MTTNGIEVPDAGVTTEYIQDPIGGWMYVVTTRVEVQMEKLTDIQGDLDRAKAELAQAQAKVDALTPQVEQAQATFVAPILDTPLDTGNNTGTSTPSN